MTRSASWVALLVLAACSPQPIPSPRPTLVALNAELERSDVDALYQLLSADARRSLSKDELRQLLARDRNELLARTKLLLQVVPQVRADVRYVDGRSAQLTVEQGELRIPVREISSLGAVTPHEALANFRSALQLRDYAAFVRLLSPRTRQRIEAELDALAAALQDTQELQIEVDGDVATATSRRGHRIELKQEDGFWTVQDFE